MKLKSRKTKPTVGMELSMTISMQPDHTVGQSADAILEFFKSASDFSQRTQAVWVHVKCTGIPVALEHLLQRAIDEAQAAIDAKPGHIRVVVDNTKK